MDGEEPLGVGVGRVRLEAAPGEKAVNTGLVVLDARLGVDGFAGAEVHTHGERLDVHVLLLQAHEVHLHSRGLLVPPRGVAKPVENEAAAELAVDAGEDVLVERRRDIGRVVVGGQHASGALSQVGPQQQPGRRVEGAAEAREKLQGLGVFVVPDRATDEDAEDRRRQVPDHLEGLLVGGQERAHRHAGDVVLQTARGHVEGSGRDIHRNIQTLRLTGSRCPQDELRLRRRARPELDDRQPGLVLAAGPPNDVVGVRLENGALGAGQVVLRQ